MCRKILILTLFTVAATTVSAQRQKYNFNPDWRVLAGNPAGATKPGIVEAEFYNSIK